MRKMLALLLAAVMALSAMSGCAAAPEEPEIQVTESVKHCAPRERVPAVEFDAGTLTLSGAKGAVLQKLFEVLPEQVELVVEFKRLEED